MLVEEGILTEEQLKRALAEQKASGRMLGEMLVEQGVIEPQVLVQALAGASASPAASSATA